MRGILAVWRRTKHPVSTRGNRYQWRPLGRLTDNSHADNKAWRQMNPIVLCAALLCATRLSLSAEPARVQSGQWITQVTTTTTRKDNPTPEQQREREAGYTSEQREALEHHLQETLKQKSESSTILTCVSKNGGLQDLDLGAHDANCSDQVIEQTTRNYVIQRHCVNMMFASDENLRIQLTTPQTATYFDDGAMDARVGDVQISTVGSSRWMGPTCKAKS
jgi:hypothetical protein